MSLSGEVLAVHLTAEISIFISVRMFCLTAAAPGSAAQVWGQSQVSVHSLLSSAANTRSCLLTCSLTGAQTCPKLSSGASEAVHQRLKSHCSVFKSSCVSLGCPLTKDCLPSQKWVSHLNYKDGLQAATLNINKIQVAFLGMYFVHSAFQDQILLQWKLRGINEAGYNSHPSN